MTTTFPSSVVSAAAVSFSLLASFISLSGVGVFSFYSFVVGVFSGDALLFLSIITLLVSDFHYSISLREVAKDELED